MDATPNPGLNPSAQRPKQPQFDPNAPHQVRPKLRPIRGFPLNANGPDGKPIQLLGLADARQISSEVVATAPAARQILPLFDGERSVDDILAQVQGLPEDFLKPFVAQLDAAGLLFGPTFDKMAAKMREEFDSSSILPPASTAAIADQLAVQALGGEATDEQKAELGPKKLREMIDTWVEQALKDATPPAFEDLPKGVIAPHFDYGRGWINYAHTYGRLRGLTPPDRIVILGVNHFGEATGVCGCDKGFATPLGELEVDTALVEALRESVGETLFDHRYDHEREHSIELQLPWLQHLLIGDGPAPKIFAALVHDPIVNDGASYDGNGVALDPFIEGLIEALDRLGGRTLIVGAVGLAHAGPAFGDQVQIAAQTDEAEQFRQKVIQTDRELLAHVAEQKLDELTTALAWQQNSNRWNATGALIAAIRVARPEKVTLLNYAGAGDQQGMSLTTSASMALI